MASVFATHLRALRRYFRDGENPEMYEDCERAWDAGRLIAKTEPFEATAAVRIMSDVTELSGVRQWALYVASECLEGQSELFEVCDQCLRSDLSLLQRDAIWILFSVRKAARPQARAHLIRYSATNLLSKRFFLGLLAAFLAIVIGLRK